MMSAFITRLRDRPNALPFLILLTLLIVFAANLYGLTAGVSIVLPHLFYIPIILAAFFYPRRGVAFAGVASIAYFLMVVAVRPDNSTDIISAAARCVVFVIIAAVVSYLSKRVSVREHELMLAKEEWERTFDSVPDLIALIDRDYHIFQVNKAMADSLGVSKEQAVGMKCFDVVHRSKTPPASCPHAALLKDGREHSAEVHEDALGGDFLVTTSPLHDADGNLIGSVHIARDITERKRIEDALRESEERYRTIIENIQDVYFRFDKESRLVMASPSAAPTFGYASVAEMIGIPASSIWKDPKARALMIETMREHGGFVQDWEAEFVKKDGTVFWASMSGHLHMDEHGGYQGKEGIIRDITERKKMQDALKAALTKLNILSSITRHDIMNQVTGLRTYLELSRKDLKGTPFAAFIEKEDQAAEAIQRQIEFTRYYQDIGVNAPKWQNAETIIREAATQLALQGIDLQVALGKTGIFADPLIVKVFFNLMENSLRHGGGVTHMSFSSRETEAGLVITYRDNGTGISAEDKKKLFQKGFGKHTGLGLFLSREILAITGITIRENGEPGKGVQFEMTVPAGAFRFSS
jgi:PAS domain S-box-containing protein